MPTKRNYGGKQQPYVPEGHGDASGEYANNEAGSNKHYASPDDVKLQLGYGGEQPKQETATPKDLSDKLNGVKDNSGITEDMKSAEYTKNFTENGESQGYWGLVSREAEVKITRGSLTKDEIGQFNKQIQDLFKEYPNMQKFTKINVKNAKASLQGGYVATYGFGERESYDLYINAGWLDKTPGERINQENIDYYKKKIEELSNNTDNNIEKIESYKKSINSLENRQAYNVITKSNSRSERLKSSLAHELMHRVTQTFDNFNVNKYAGNIEKHNTLNEKYRSIQQEIRDVYSKALQNGDAKKISTYATTSRDEFLSEANAQLEVGIETPQYIADVVNNMKNFLRSEMK